jgi:NAD(P)-dependent dehydrogenase (short-subunit alcohol dehydrogenase family)
MSKVWLITGSSRGLGRAFTEAALAAGNQVVATARKVSDLDSLKDQYGKQVLPLPLDVTDETQARDAIKMAIGTFGRLDVLVNNAGYGNVAPIEDTTLEDFRAQIETNLFGVIILTKAVLPYFRERRAGHIFQITSIADRLGPIGRAPYAAAKWGVEGFSETLAKELGLLGVKVTIVEPGGFRTDFAGTSTELREGRPEYDETVGATVRFKKIITAGSLAIPLKRLSHCSTSPQWTNRRCASSWEATLLIQRKKTTWPKSNWVANGNSSAFRRTSPKVEGERQNHSKACASAPSCLRVFVV